MFTSVKSTLAAVALLLALVQTSRAEDAAKVPLPQIAFIAAKSIDSVTGFVKKTGLDLPPEMSTDGLEKQFPFLGPGSLDTTRPIGIAVCGGADISTGQSMAFIFPVKPTGGTLESLKKLGATPMPDHPDSVVMGGVGLRRTADYLIFSPTADVVSNVNLDAFTASVKSDDALVKLAFDLKTFRTAIPDRYKAMTDAFQASVLAGSSKAEQENSMVSVKAILNVLDTIDRAEVGVESGEKGVRLAITATPLKVATAAAANRPGMPAGVFARIDTNIAPTEWTGNVRTQLQKAFNGGFIGNGPVSDEKRKEMETIGNKLGALISDAATTSLGVEIVDKAPVLYIVQHWSKAVDAPKEWKHLIEEGNAASSGGDKKEEIGTETYTEGTLSVVRLTIKKDQPVHVDIAQRDNDVLIAISPSDGHHIANLAAAEAQGPMKGILSGSVDLGKSIEAATKMPDSPLAGMPADVQKQLVDLLAGQQITITTSADGDAGTLEIAVTKGMLENIPKLMGILNGK